MGGGIRGKKGHVEEEWREEERGKGGNKIPQNPHLPV